MATGSSHKDNNSINVFITLMLLTFVWPEWLHLAKCTPFLIWLTYIRHFLQSATLVTLLPFNWVFHCDWPTSEFFPPLLHYIETWSYSLLFFFFFFFLHCCTKFLQNYCCISLSFSSIFHELLHYCYNYFVLILINIAYTITHSERKEWNTYKREWWNKSTVRTVISRI